MLIAKNMIKRVEDETRKLNASEKIKFGQFADLLKKLAKAGLDNTVAVALRTGLGRFQAGFGGLRPNRVSLSKTLSILREHL
jgi:hypothetical protein